EASMPRTARARQWLGGTLLFALGCAPFGSPSGSAFPAGTEWTLVALEGQPPVGPVPLTLLIEVTRLSGYGGCNQYRGSYEASNGTLAIGPVSSTRRACLEQALTEQETRFHEALGRVRGYRTSGDVLELTDGGEAVLLRFEAA